MKRRINHHDFLNATINDQETINTATTVEENGCAFFILAADGANIIIKNLAGDVVYTVTTPSFLSTHPIRIEDGFEIEGTDVSVLFCRVKYNP